MEAMNESFYQLPTYTDDVDLNKKLAERERFYKHLSSSHGSHGGMTPYEILYQKLSQCSLRQPMS